MSDPKDVVAAAMPGWQVVDVGPPPSGSRDPVVGSADRVALEFSGTVARYKDLLSTVAHVSPVEPREAVAAGATAAFVRVRPRNPNDASAGEKTLLVLGDRIIGSQG